MSVVAIDAGGMAVVVEQRALGSIVRGGGRGKWMSDFGRNILGEDAGRGGRDVGAAIVAGDAILLIGAAQQTGRPLGVVGGVAADAGILGDSGVAADISLWRELVLHKRVGVGRPIGEGVDFAGDLASWIVAGEAHLAAGTVADEKILGDRVFGHHVGVVASSALDIAVDKLDSSGGIPGFAGGSE